MVKVSRDYAEGVAEFHVAQMMDAIAKGDADRARVRTLSAIWACKNLRDMGGSL